VSGSWKPTLTVGFSFLDLTPGVSSHLWFVCTRPDQDGEVAIVSITSTKEWTKDFICQLVAGEHPFIQHDSVAAYQLAKLLTAATIEARIKRLDFQPKEPGEPELMQRLREGAIVSDYTPNIVKGCIRRCSWYPPKRPPTPTAG
jgi:hypothetical protein